MDRVAVVVEASEAAGAVEDGEAAVGILVHSQGGFDVVMAVGLRGDL